MLLRLVLVVTCVHYARCSICFSRKVCYNDTLPLFPCYNTSAPFTNTFGILPMSPTEQNITFKLFTRMNNATPEILGARNETSVLLSNITRNGKVAFIIHGFQDNSNEQWVVNLKEELLSRVPNVIAVDWSKGAAGVTQYFQAVANTRVVGAQVATMIITIVNARVGITENNIHLIGHSLGAHVAGYAGKKFTTCWNRIGRISGLDPAGPRFEKFKTPVRLDRGDAECVDVIHTSTRLLPNGLGIRKNIGDVDFWPNGGKVMPGCEGKIFDGGRCSHNIVREYFRASINDAVFTANPCNTSSTAPPNFMGYHANCSNPGIFCLRTGAHYPYEPP